MYFMAYIIAYLFWTILISLALHLSAQILCVIEAQTPAKTLQIVIQSAAMLKVEHAQLPIWRLVPRRFEQGQATPEVHESEETLYLQIYYTGLDSIINCIVDRFDQSDWKIYAACEQLLFKTIKKVEHEDELKTVLDSYDNMTRVCR